MSAKFVVSHLDQQLGPFSEAELKEKWQKGDLLPIDYVYDEVKADWILMAERFEWAAVKPEAANPPPIRADVVRRRRPPEPPKEALPASAPAPASAQASTPAPALTVEISGGTVVKEWKKAAGQGAKVKLVDGVGELDLSPQQPGQVELVLQDSSSTMLKLQEPLRVQVRAAEPEEIVWAFTTQQPVGQELEIMLKAVDAHGTLCSHYSDTFTVRASADGSTVSQNHEAVLSEGQAVVKISHTKAEKWIVALDYRGTRKLRLPESRSFDWQPGPAVKLVLDGPPTLTAGQPLKVQVKAVDAYGNLAKTFQGTVILEVKAS